MIFKETFMGTISWDVQHGRYVLQLCGKNGCHVPANHARRRTTTLTNPPRINTGTTKDMAIFAR